MAVLKKEEFLARLKEKIGDSTADEDVKFIEDMTDTFNDMEKKTEEETKWEEKYKENDKMWREKYRDRFFSAPADEKAPEIDTDDEPKKYTFENLFKEEK